MPLPKKFVHQLPVMLEPRQYEHVLKLADGGSQAQVVRDAIDLQLDVMAGTIQTIPAEDLRELQTKGKLIDELTVEVGDLADQLAEARRELVSARELASA